MSDTAHITRADILNRARHRLTKALAQSDAVLEAIESIDLIVAQALAEIEEGLARTAPVSLQLLRGTITRKRDGKVMSLQLQDDQKVTYSISETDDAGNATPFAGTATWSSSDESILTVTASDDGSSADVETTGTLGTAQVAVSVDFGDGSDPIGASDDVTVVVSAPTGFTLTAGTPEHQ